jgi:effector-binding domain-containing protein
MVATAIHGSWLPRQFMAPGCHGISCSTEILLGELYIHVTVHRDRFLFNNQPDALIKQIYCHKTLHVSGIFSAHHQEFSTVYSALVSFMQVSILTLLGSGKLPGKSFMISKYL